MKTQIKYWLRSGSYQFMRDNRRGLRTDALHHYVWRGKPIYYRPGSSDTGLIYKILLKRRKKAEYYIPLTVNPSVILDVGGNIGVASVYFANRFPSARIFTFEPAPENFAILSKNVSPYPNIHPFHLALGKQDGALEMYCSDHPNNFGAYSFYEKGSNTSKKILVTVRSARNLLAEIGVSRVDMIKIDTEGSEFDILTSMDEGVMKNVKWIVGELHGEHDFELLAYLSCWFEIQIKKQFKKRLFMFHACNKQFMS
ncbi:MAG: FkbM family methyltransferase, partial [Gammaproteobacteria bacterium]|nr:FkbM family methyltransferase [Gammaproteobacteria bacterium]